MDKTNSYPSIHQAIKIIIFYLLISTIIPPLIIKVIEKSLHYNIQEPIKYLFIVIVSFIILLFSLRNKKKISFKSLFACNSSIIYILFPLILVVIGNAIIQSEIDNYIRTFIPMNKDMIDFLSNTVIGKENYIASIITTILIAPLIEEIIFRGIILKGFLEKYSVRKSIFISALLFGIFHLNPWQLLGAFFWGLILGWIFEKTHSLIPCFFGHALNNSMSFIINDILNIKISGYSSNFNIIEHQPLWFDLMGILILCLGILVITNILTK